MRHFAYLAGSSVRPTQQNSVLPLKLVQLPEAVAVGNKLCDCNVAEPGVVVVVAGAAAVLTEQELECE